MSKSFVLKILTAGDGGVGKTTLLHRYVEGNFLEDTSMTIGVEFLKKQLNIGEFNVALQLWDFGGQEQFRHMLPNYVIGAKGALLLFDLTRMGTLDNLEEWVDICRGSDPNLPIIFIGTKLDLFDEIMVDDDYVREIQEELNLLDYIKISSKTGENLNKLFEILAKEIIKREQEKYLE